MPSLQSGMIPDQAIAVHLMWKLALVEAVRTGAALNLDPVVLGRPDRCELGLWLESPRASGEGIDALRLLHRQFHACAGDLGRRLRASGPQEPVGPMLAELEALSTKLVNRLGSWAG